MTTVELTDEDARRIIVERTDQTIFVEAGAGTGKTTELVGRIVALIRGGVPVSRIAAITFTEKAAAELGERVRRRIEQAESTASDPALRAVFATALKELDQAAIQTLHSFAMRILSLYPLEAGLPPRISLRDDVEASLAFDDRWARFQDRLLDDPETERVLLRGLTVGLRLRDLEGVAEGFNENWDRLENLVLPAAPEPLIRPERVLDPMRELRSMRRPGVNDSLTRKLDAVESFVSGLQGVSDVLQSASGEARERLEVDALRILARMPDLTSSTSGRTGGMGRKEYWHDIQAARELIAEAEQKRREMLDGTRSWVLCEILPRISRFVLEGAGERRRAGELEFHDLLVLARDLLRRRPDVRRALYERFSRILIDEFQDTDPIQVELAALLAHSGDAQPQNWDEAATEAGRLFFVGDPKQSIYRFRRADIELFKRARGAFSAQQVPLSKNFRCRPGIIEWVNLVCERLFGGFGAGPDERQADWIPLQAARPATRGPVVHVMGGPAEEDVLAPEIRRREAEAIAAAVLAAKRDNWLGENERGRTTRFSDIAILLPTRTNSPAIERALAAVGVPTRIESRSLLFAAQEIRDLTNILAAIDDPTDDVAVVAALRSPAFAVQDGELLEHVQAGGRWDYTRECPQSPEPVREAMAAVSSFHDARWLLSIGALVERVIAERRMLELAVATSRPREAWRRLRFVSEQARALGDSGAVTSLRQFVHWLRTQASERVLIAEAVANEPDDDAVRILTVHASKGLEFPIVILAGLGIEPRPLRPNIAWAHDDEGRETAGVHIGRMGSYFETPGYDDLWQNEKVHEALERDRLFYVAATRAKERLVVSLFYKALKSSNDHASRHANRRCSVAECLWAIQKEEGNWPVLQIGMALGAGLAATSSAEESAEQREAWLREREERIARLRDAPVRAVTALVHGEEEDDKPEPEVEDQPWRKGRAGTSIGRAVHAVMQTVDLTTGDGIRQIAESQAMAEGITDEAAHVARLAENARTSAAVQAAVTSGRYWRELYVGVDIGGMVIEGFVDLLYESPNGLVVVDYKTDSVRDEAAIDAAMERYRLQGAAYALALERALGRPVARAVFVFTEPRTEREVTDLQGAKAEIEARLAHELLATAREG